MTEPTWRPYTKLYKYQFMSVILANTSSAENPIDLLWEKLPFLVSGKQ